MSINTITKATFGGNEATATSPVGVVTSMLKEFLPYELLFEELMKRDYLLTKVAKDQSWKGGELSVPFMGGKASSFAYGELTDIDDITEDRPVRGKVSEYREIWGSMIFHQKDLDQHGDMKSSFLKLLPDRLEDFIDRMKEAVSVNLLNGQHFDVHDSVGANNLAAGVIAVKRIARFQIGQYVAIGSVDESTDVAEFKFQGYVRSIDIENQTIELVDIKDVHGTGAVVVDLSLDPGNGFILATDKLFLRGALGAPGTILPSVGATNANTRRGFTSLRSQLLSFVNGGSQKLFGIDKTLYPHLQAVNVNGGGISANMLQGLFNGINKAKLIGKGNPVEILMSFENQALAMKQLEEGAGGTTYGRQFTAGDTSVNPYGWTSISISGVQGSLVLTGIQEMDDDVMFMMDWRGLKLFSNGFFERRRSPEGEEYHTERTVSGYKYVVDTRFYGELILSKPSHCGIFYGVN